MNTAACKRLQQFLQNELKQAQRWQKALQKSRDPENVHQLRICLRKLRTALKLAKPILNPCYRRRWQKRLRDAAKQLDKARDLDVFLQSLAALPSTEKTAQKHLQKQRRRTYKVLREKLHSAPFCQWRKLNKQLQQPGWTKQRCRKRRLNLNQFAFGQLEPIYQKIKLAHGQLNTLDEVALHRLRIQCKQLRYACELVEPALRSQSRSGFLESLRQLQDRLGALHDASVQQSLLASCPTPQLAVPVPVESKRVRKEIATELGRLLSLSKPWSSIRRK